MQIAVFRSLGILLLLSAGISGLRAQSGTQITDPNIPVSTLPSLSARDSASGSPYLVKGWLPGTLVITGQRKTAEKGPLFFNYDKMKERLYVTDGSAQPWSYGQDSIESFILIDSNVTYRFTKVPLITTSHVLQVLVQSQDGYSLYKHLVARFVPADFENQGFRETGLRSDRYMDQPEYFLVYSGHDRFRKLKLSVRDIKKALPLEAGRLDKFFAQDSGPVAEQTFVLLLRNLNEQHGFQD